MGLPELLAQIHGRAEAERKKLMEHHPYGPSRIWLRAGCAGSLKMSRDMPPIANDEASSRGRLLHRLMIPSVQVKEIDTIEALPAWDLALLRRAQAWRDTAPERLESVDYERPLGPLPLEDVPKWLWPFGTADVVYGDIDGTEVLIRDYKFLFQDLDEERAGPQMRAYAALAFGAFTDASVIAVEVYDAQADAQFSATLSRENDFPLLIREYRRIILESEDQTDWKLSPALGRCQYCEGLARCPAAMHVARAVGQTRHGIPLDTFSRTPAELGVMVSDMKLAKEIAERWLDWARDRVRENPECIRYWKLKRSSRRSLANPQGVRAVLSQYLGAPDFWASTRFLIGEIEARFVKSYRTGFGGTVQHAKDQLERLLGDLLVHGEESFSLVPDRDRKLLE